jgi:hypothetical protein
VVKKKYIKVFQTFAHKRAAEKGVKKSRTEGLPRPALEFHILNIAPAT